MDVPMLPQAGVEYKLNLGETMRGQPADLCYMRHDFKPASASRQGQGSMSIDRSEVALALPNGSTGSAAHQFRGNFEHSKDDMDCVLVFDGHGFSLEALAGRINNLRHLRPSQRGGSRAPAAELASQPAAAQTTCPSQEREVEPQQAAVAVGQPSHAAADGWAFGAPNGVSSAALPPAAAAASNPDNSTSSDSSAGGSDDSSEESEQPAIGNLSRREADAPNPAAAPAELAAAATEPAAVAPLAAEAVSVGRMPPPGAEELTPEELAFFGYTPAQVAAAPQPVEQPEASSSGSSDGDSSSSSSDDSSDSSGSEAGGDDANAAEGGSAENALNGGYASDDLERAMKII